jgi:hyperosmotically inducible protein
MMGGPANGKAPVAGCRHLNQPDGRKKMKLRLLIVIGLALALAAPLLAQEATQPNARASERITREVRHELLMLPYLDVFDNIAYKVDGYNVTLMGQVTRPTLKSDAGNVVKRIEGVEHVDNQIEVLPPSPNDDRLRLRVYRAIYGYPAMQKYALGVQKPIRIIVKNGHVTLEGVVDNEGDKNIANIRANSVAGTFSVTNNLQVVKN